MSIDTNNPMIQLQKMKTFTNFQVEEMSAAPDLILCCQEFEETAFVVVWMNHKVVWGIWDGNKLELPSSQNIEMDYILEFRIFNVKRETRAFNSGSAWIVRKIFDELPADKGNAQEYVDSVTPFLGETVEVINDSFSKCSDKGRKIHQIIPFVRQEKGRIGLVTRNYVGYSDITGQASYTVNRYLDIISVNKE